MVDIDLQGIVYVNNGSLGLFLLFQGMLGDNSSIDHSFVVDNLAGVAIGEVVLELTEEPAG